MNMDGDNTLMILSKRRLCIEEEAMTVVYNSLYSGLSVSVLALGFWERVDQLRYIGLGGVYLIVMS